MSSNLVQQQSGQTSDYQAVFAWLQEEADKRHIDARLYTHLVKQDHNWLYLPVFVAGADAGEKAATLQQLEDAWRNQDPEPYWQILLIPAAN